MIAPDWRGMLASFRRAWLWPGEWPRDFFDSRLFGAGFFFWFMWITLPILDHVIDRDTALLLILFVVIAIVAQDFWLPRWSMTLVLAIVVCVGGALSWLALKGPSWAYLLLLPAVLFHLVRPIYDVHGMAQMARGYLRINISESPLFIDGKIAPGELELYPDLDADLLIVHPVDGWWLGKGIPGLFLKLSGSKAATDIYNSKTIEERRAVARRCGVALQYEIPTYVDEMGDRVNKAYAAWPTRLYLIGLDGRVVYAGGLGPFGFKPAEFKAAIEGCLG